MKDVVATMVASLEKQAHVDARLILKLLNRVISNKVSLSDLSVLLDQFPSRLFLPFLSLLFPADSHLFQLLAPVRRVVRARPRRDLHLLPEVAKRDVPAAGAAGEGDQRRGCDVRL